MPQPLGVPLAGPDPFTFSPLNQLTGSEAFILEIEQRIGERILHRIIRVYL